MASLSAGDLVRRLRILFDNQFTELELATRACVACILRVRPEEIAVSSRDEKYAPPSSNTGLVASPTSSSAASSPSKKPKEKHVTPQRPTPFASADSRTGPQRAATLTDFSGLDWVATGRLEMLFIRRALNPSLSPLFVVFSSQFLEAKCLFFRELLFFHNHGEVYYDNSFPSFLLVHITEDPWSGQIGWPGGRKQDKETDYTTAVRETFEEIGLSLDDSSQFMFLGRLDDRPVRRVRGMKPLAISCQGTEKKKFY